MALHIRNSNADKLVEQITALTGESKTEAIVTSMRDRLMALRSNDTKAVLKEEIEAIVSRFNSHPVRDSRSDDEILGYNEYGLPE
ncbi:MAG: type II toxin-antitoxin system VapB family antitoxin [Leptolyngbya sp. SIO4C1]|nr:type II toxin-antitoxin system VapB family antitoxin [Leptolyngbya sp. SIO4C1]